MVFAAVLSPLFSIGGLMKAFGAEGFVLTIHKHEILPAEEVPLVAWTVALIEVVVGLLLGIGLLRLRYLAIALLCTLSMLVTFTVYLIVVAAVRGAHEGCGCGAIVHTSAMNAIIRNAILILVALGAFLVMSRRIPP